MRNASVVDLFSGVGGMSLGFQQAGYEVVAGYDNDPTCADPFESGHEGSVFRTADVLAVSGRDISAHFLPMRAKVLIACCPCQPYSALRRRPDRPVEDSTTIDAFAIQIRDIDADVVIMENVPALQTYKGGETLAVMIRALVNCGYKVNADVLNAFHYGTPQMRHRLVTVASRDGYVPSPARTHCPSWSGEDAGGFLPGVEGGDMPSLRNAIGDLKPLEAGESDPDDPMHAALSAGELTMKRIKVTPEGGDWRDWPVELREPRFKKKFGDLPKEFMKDAYSGSFGRQRWDLPSYTLTTNFCKPGNGNFLHPRQHRAFTPREGARIQGFPDDFDFIPKGERMNMARESRHIGNAVPPPLAKAVALQIAETLGL